MSAPDAPASRTTPSAPSGTRPRRLDRHAIVRQINEEAVLDVIFREGPVSRVSVAEITGLSKPTVNTLVSALCDMGLVRQVGTTSGQVGRAAALYAVNPNAGHVVGVDLGGTKVRAAVANLFGEIVGSQIVSTVRAGSDAVIGQVVALVRSTCAEASVDWSTVRSVVVGAPGVVSQDTGMVALASNIHGLDRVPFTARLTAELRIDVTAENDANLAAVGESWRGCAVRCDDFVFLAIGTGIGMGIVAGGELFRGSKGAAGEISFLPLGADPFDPKVRRRGALEEAAAGAGVRALMRRHRGEYPGTILGPRPSVEQIFAAASAGDALGLRLLDEEARTIALAVLSACAVLDTELVVLGGGIGTNPMLLEPVRRYLAACLPYPVRVETSRLGELAALHGALAVGLRGARAGLLPEPAAR